MTASLSSGEQSDASKGNMARCWKLFPVTMDDNQFGDEKILATKLSDPGWLTAFSQVNGDLLKSQMQAALKTVASRDPRAIFVAAQVHVSGGEPFKFKVHGIASEKPAWLDGKRVDGKGPLTSFITLPAAPGMHVLMMKFDADTLPQTVRFEVSGGAFLTN